MSREVRKTILTTLRIAVCAAALWFVARGVTLNDQVISTDGTVLSGAAKEYDDRVELRDINGTVHVLPKITTDDGKNLEIVYGLKTALGRSDRLILFMAFLIQFPVVFLLALRLKIMLHPQQIALKYWECVRLTFVGNFLNFATPLGSNAGDVFKAYFITKHTHRKTEAATTIFLDRAVGLGTLILVVSVLTLFVPESSQLRLIKPYVFTTLAVGVIVLLAYQSSTIRNALLGLKRIEKSRLFDQLKRVDSVGQSLTNQKTIMAVAVFISFLLQMLAITGFFAVAAALAMKTGFANVVDYFTCFFTGSFVQALPGPPQGLGTVELVYRFFLKEFGSPSQIICVALAIRVTVLTAALPGLFISLTGSYHPRHNSQGDKVDTHNVRRCHTEHNTISP